MQIGNIDRTVKVSIGHVAELNYQVARIYFGTTFETAI